MMDKATTYSNTSLRTLLALVLAAAAMCVACAMGPVQHAHAAETGSITLNYKSSETGEPISYMAVYLFKIADRDGGDYVLSGAFTGYSDILGWNNGRTSATTDASWLQQQAETLDAYVRAAAPDPASFGTTDGGGVITFGGLDDGLYLVIEAGDGVHLFTASLIDVGGAEGRDLVVEPKNTTPNNPPASIKVVKHWSGDTESDRPASIKVQLVCDDAVYGSAVELSDENAWTYTWDGLDASVTHKWDVMELDAPSGYAVSINEDNGDFTITNTLNPTPPNNPGTPTTPTTPSKTITGKLPQTGQLWWPVPVLFCAGLIAIGAGRIVSTRSRAK